MSKDDLPTVDIKGKAYVLVKDRIAAFNEMYKLGSIKTEIHSYEGGQVIVKATVCPDVSIMDRTFTGYSQERESNSGINSTSALENAETSAVGRALAMMGIGVIESIASADEVAKATRPVGRPPKPQAPTEPLPGEGEESVAEELDRKTAPLTENERLIEESMAEQAVCEECGSPAQEKSGTSKAGKPYHGLFCTNENCKHVKWLPTK